MTEIILMLIAAILCIIGLTEVIHTVKSKLLTPVIKAETELFIYVSGEDADLQLSCALREYTALKLTNIVAVYYGDDSDKKEVCRKIAKRYNINFRE